MGNGPELPGEWDSSGPSEPPAQLLRRAISHVESLLHRLESPDSSRPALQGAIAGPSAPTVPADVVERPVEYPVEPPVEAVARDETADGEETDRPRADNVVDLARVSQQTQPPQQTQQTQPVAEPEPATGAEVVALPALNSTAQADALRITLHAHEEANRLRAEANGLRAEAAAEGERILVEARLLSDRLHIESRESATELLQAARNEAAAVLEAARAEAEQIAQAAREDADRARAELDLRAEQDRAAARAAMLDEVAEEAERIRVEALDAGRAEAARLVEAEVAAAASEGRRAVEASRSRAQDLLTSAHDGIEDVRSSMRRLLEEMNDALVGFNAAVGTVEQTHDSVAELAPDDPPEIGSDGRRPLGLLFGAPRG